MDICSLSLADLVEHLDAGRLTSVDVTTAYLERIEANDRHGPQLNAAPILNPQALSDARHRDAEREQGRTRGLLHGVPFLVKDSYGIRGLSVSNGSPAFAECIATKHSWVVERLQAEGAIVLGKTTMPPMAAGGMQEGLYGVATSPFNPNFHPAAWFSGSSQGSAVALAAGYAPFTMGEETVSSGRSPASNNGIVAYTPSNGLISIDRSWPLLPMRDVVVPYTRSVADLFLLLRCLWSRPSHAVTDFWLRQTYLAVPDPDEAVAGLAATSDDFTLEGRRVAVPSRWIGPNAQGDPHMPAAVESLIRRTVIDLEQMGLEVEITDFPLMDDYAAGGVLTPIPDPLNEELEDFANAEFSTIATAGWELFLRSNQDAVVSSLGSINAEEIFPERFRGLPDKYNPLPRIALDPTVTSRTTKQLEDLLFDNPLMRTAVHALDSYRRRRLDEWMHEREFDFVAFPASTDHASTKAASDPSASIRAWQEGVACSTGNFMVRQLGLPTLTLPIGRREDNGMPLGLTLLSTPGDDVALLQAALHVERNLQNPRDTPPRVRT
jgi:amidase